MSEATCLMANCNRSAPADEAFCSKHRERRRNVDEAKALREALEWLESYLRDTPHHNSPAAANARAVLRATMHSDCPQSHDGRHHVDTSMEEGPHHCFHCGTNLRNPRTPDSSGKPDPAALEALSKAATQGESLADIITAEFVRSVNQAGGYGTIMESANHASRLRSKVWLAAYAHTKDFPRTGQLVPRAAVDLVGANTLPTEYARWLSSIEVDVRVHDLTADEVARLVAALTKGEDHAN